MISFALIATLGETGRIDPFIESLPDKSARRAYGLDVVIVLCGSAVEDARSQAARSTSHPGVTVLGASGATVEAARAFGAARTSADWIAFVDASRPLAALPLDRVAAFLVQTAAAGLSAMWIAGSRAAVSGPRVFDLAAEPVPLLAARNCFFRRSRLPDEPSQLAPIASGTRGEALAAVRLVSRIGETRIGWMADGAASQAKSDDDGEPRWSDPETYRRQLRESWETMLEQALAAHGRVPLWLQRWAVHDLCRFFEVDMRPKAPTMGVTGAAADAFHDGVRRILGRVDRSVIETLPLAGATEDVRQALLSYRPDRRRSAMALDAYDHPQGLARLTYCVHDEAPLERFEIDGVSVRPNFAKFRACNFFGRTLFRQRIVWIAASRGERLQVWLDGVPESVTVDGVAKRPGPAPRPEPFVTLARSRASYPNAKGGQKSLPGGIGGLKARLVCGLSRLPPVRRRFRDGWVFIDREEGADDSAEHLYRWTRKHHPEVNIWFMLMRESPDWARLAAEGFRLVAPGLTRRLMILNSVHIISSHTDYVFGGFDRRIYGNQMTWRYTFLQHGVIKDDLSHWLAPREFDRFITSSPAEHASVAGDGTPYPYTDREVRRTGLPRHDELFRIEQRTPASEVNILLVMPTWRGSLIDERSGSSDGSDALAAFAASDYARFWGGFLRDSALREIAERAGLQVVFMPHPNAVPYLEAFQAPAHVEVRNMTHRGVQEIFARTVGFITDYTSVAFTMAFLRRQVFYCQFDRERFYGGDHNWREGYFDYARDGFGPVSFSREELMAQLQRFAQGGCKVDARYLERMEQAMPDRDDQACSRVYRSILDLGAPAVPVSAAAG